MEWLIALLPFALIVLACHLVMHFFMRGAHGGHSGQARSSELDNSAGRIAQLEEQLSDLSQRMARANEDDKGVVPTESHGDAEVAKPAKGDRDG